MHAADQGHEAVVGTLLQAHANPDLKSKVSMEIFFFFFGTEYIVLVFMFTIN